MHNDVTIGAPAGGDVTATMVCQPLMRVWHAWEVKHTYDLNLWYSCMTAISDMHLCLQISYPDCMPAVVALHRALLLSILVAAASKQGSYTSSTVHIHALIAYSLSDY